MSVLPILDLDRQVHVPMRNIALDDPRRNLKQSIALRPFIHTTPKSLKTDTVVISDIHMGSDVSRAEDALKVLRSWYPFRQLVILGDLFEDLNLSNLKPADYAFLDELRRLSSQPSVEVHWVEGNHDEGGHRLVERLIGCRTHSELVLDILGKSYLFMHGHQFDIFMQKHPVISKVGSRIYINVQTREGMQRTFSRWLKKKSKQWLKVCKRIEALAMDHAAGYGVDYIVCGHTHYFDATCASEESNIKYINTGCWTDYPSTLTTICGNDGLQQHSYH